MKPVEFPEVNVRIAEHQEEFVTLPAYANRKEGTITFCMELTEEEKKEILGSGHVWIQLVTYNQPMQPIALSTLRDDLIPPERPNLLNYKKFG